MKYVDLSRKKLGYEEEFTDGKETQLDWIKEFYANSKAQAEEKGIKMPSFDEFWEKGFVKFEVKEIDKNFTRYEKYVTKSNVKSIRNTIR